ncbi:uncharacterized protein EDB91DRAFT_1222426 [Suillus paluster]|uniref:uncharacterized protein n=1 Tax=Suillus paluster TaxID=48578 RepID=UPI001B863F9F|nr:uncharacterized protein EDB91DRAFT_1222426 [Suillus paluster]KAG1741516.1 hypothetical protein EDB91DRAFT_1222426 [Suillus paluster]
MLHSFVIAKFIPQGRSTSWTSYYWVEKATSLTTRSFLVLRISRSDIGSDDKSQLLFVISPQKPGGVNDGCYITLGSSLDEGKKILHVEPFLCPEGGTLYVHTFPSLLEDREFKFSYSPAFTPPASPAST